MKIPNRVLLRLVLAWFPRDRRKGISRHALMQPMLRRACRQGLVIVVLIMVASCGKSSDGSPTSPSRTLVSLAIEFVDFVGTRGTVPVLDTVTLHAIATYSDQTTQDVTGDATWTSSDAAVVLIDAAGIVRGRMNPQGMDTAQVTASFQDRSATVDLTVVDNWQDVTVTVDTLTILGSCDHDSIFESPNDGEFEFMLTWGGGTVWRRAKTTYSERSYAVNAAATLPFRAATPRLLYHPDVLFEATEYDGALGADRDMNHKVVGTTVSYAGDGKWNGGNLVTAIGKGSAGLCGARLEFTTTSKPIPAP